LTLDRPENFQGKRAVFTPKLQFFFKNPSNHLTDFFKKLQFRSKKHRLTDFLVKSGPVLTMPCPFNHLKAGEAE
jgi:hypothetical protein